MSKSNNLWKTISSKVLHQSQWLDLYQDEVIKPNGEHGIYTYIKSPPFVLVVAFDGLHFIMIRQYRYPIGQMVTEFPGGSIDGNESTLESARREFEEETGYKAKKFTQIGSILNPNEATVFLAEDLEKGQNKMSEDGIESFVRLTRDEINRMMDRSELTDSKTLACLLLFDRYELSKVC